VTSDLQRVQKKFSFSFLSLCSEKNIDQYE